MIAVVTGGAGTVGSAVRKKFEVAVSIDCVAAKSELEVTCDLTDELAIKRTFEDIYNSYGELSVLINCVGGAHDTDIKQQAALDWDAELEKNLKSVFLATKCFSKYCAPSAAIVNVGSVNAHYGSARRMGYGVAKAALEGFTRLCAVQLAPVRVNCAVLGSIQSNMSSKSAHCVLGRQGTPEEAADAIVFLASPAASYITGAVLFVDGGYGLA